MTEFFPGLLLFGSDGGGEGFAFSMRDTPWSVVQVPFSGAPNASAYTPRGRNFLEFFRSAGSGGLNRLHQPCDKEPIHPHTRMRAHVALGRNRLGQFRQQ